MPLTRPGQINLAPILSAQPPTIDLHLPAYEASTRNFLQAIADFNSRAIAEINQRREAHTTEMNRLAERAQNVERETNQCKIKEIELIGGSCRALLALKFCDLFVLNVVVVVVVLQCLNAILRRPRRQNLLSLRFGARLHPSARQSRLSMQT
jgi:hypothetical protein